MAEKGVRSIEKYNQKMVKQDTEVIPTLL